MSGIETLGSDAAAGADMPAAIIRSSRFSASRAVEHLVYIAMRVSAPTIHELLKIRYFADKLHLSEFGMTASGDDYVAMKFGPVGSHTYDLLKAARGDKNQFIPQAFYALVTDAIKVAGENVTALRDAKIEKLSRSDIGCLDEAIGKYKNMNFTTRTALSHDAAWEKGWSEAQQAKAQQGEMKLVDIAQTLENAAEVLECISA
jgi:hypothetical protein